MFLARAPLPLTVSVPKIVAPEYMITSSSMVGWRFLPLSFETSPRAARLAVPKMVKNGSARALFASYVLLVSLGFAFVLDFFAGTGLLEHV
jgi:hypothetical protein